MFAFRESRGPVDVAFTDRAGGVSKPPFTSLNLAAVGLDERSAVSENIRLTMRAFAGSADAPVAMMRQVHGAGVAVVSVMAPAVEEPPSVDGLVTALSEVTLAVRVADCVPVLLADPDCRIVGALHAGREGLVSGIIPAGLEAMRRLRAEHLVAWVGPHVCGRCYEVPAPLRDDVCDVVPEAWAETAWGTPAVDVGAGVVAQLTENGVEVVDAARCTLEHEDLYSFRRDGERAGRMAGLVRVRA